MSKYELVGEVVRVGDEQQISDKFSKREIVVRIDDGRFPQDIPLERTNEKCRVLDNFSPGDRVRVEFALRGRYWENGDRYFSSLYAIYIEKVGGEASAGSGGVSTPADDDIPF